MSKWNGLYLITLAVFVAACSDAEQQLAPLEEEYGIELHYHEDNPYPEPLPELEHEQVEAMLMQVSAYMQEDEADYRVDHALLQAEEVALSINLASGHTDDEVQRTITGSVGLPGLNEADWNALEDKEAAMDWRLLEDATAINVGMGGIDWDAGPVIVMNESEDSITIRSEGQWNGLFDFEGTHVTFSTSSHWEIELDKEAVIDQIIFPAET